MRRLLFCGKFSSGWGVFAVVLLWPALLSSQPSWVWAEGVIGGSDQRGMSIAADASGNSLSTGYFKGNADFDGNVLSSSGNEDAYVTKYDVNGNRIWAIKIAGSGEQRGLGITTDASGNSYVCGMIDGVTTFYGSVNIIIAPTGNKDAFVAKYNPGGQVLWAKHVVCSNADEALAISTNGANVFVTGYFSGTATFGALSPLTSSGGEDVFIASYSCATGTEQWALKGGSTGNDRGDGIAVDASGVYVGGYYTNATITFQNQIGSLATIGGTDIFVVKYNLTGTSGLWQRRAGSNNNDEGNCLTVGSGGVYVGGFFDNTMNIYNSSPVVVATITTANNHDGCIIKYDATTGNYSWVVSENGQGDDHIYDISCSPFDVVYATGSWNGTLPFGSGPSVNSGAEDVFVTCYNSAGVFLSGMRATGTDDEEGYGISASYANAVYVTGYFKSNTTTFGATPSLSASSEDIFISKILCGVTASNAGTDQTVCATAATLNGNTPASGTGLWTLISGTGSITTPSSPNSGVTALGVGANVFRWTITLGGCVSFDDVTITSDASPTTSAAGVDQTICSTTATLAGNIPVTGTGVWTLISGAGTITTPTSANSGLTAIGVGNNVFQWAISNGVCPSSTDQVTIARSALPTTATAGTDQTICNSGATLTGNTPVTGTGLWTLISGSGSITTPTSPTSTITGLGVSSNVFQWTITNGVCPSSSDQVTITRDANPTVSAGGSDQTICSTTSAFTGNTPTIGAGVWTLISGSGTVTTPTSSSSGITGLTVGNNIFQWTISNGTCPSSSDQVTITVDPNPTVANAGSDQTICSSTSSFVGNAPAVGTGMWTLISGTGSVTTPTSPTSNVTGLSVGANVFRWTISNGTCPSSFDEVTITRDPNPTVSAAGSDQTICSTTSALTGNAPTIGAGVWTLVSGTGNATIPTSPSSGITGLSVGNNIFQWTISNGTCPSSSDQITITVDPNPTVANAGPDQTICSSTSSFIGNTPAIGTGMWTLISGTGNFTAPSSATSGVTGLSIGANVFEWTISNGTCPSSSDQVTITVDPNPTVAIAGSDQTICSTTSALTGNAPTIGAGVWTLVSGTGNATIPTSPSSGITGLSVGNNIFQWTISNGTCPSSSDQVTITVDPNPTVAIAGSDQTICSTTSALIGNAPTIGAGVWTLVSGTGSATTPTSPSSGVTGLSVGNNIFQWTISNGTCPSSSDQVTITVDPNPTVANAGPDQTICSSTSSFVGNTPAIGTGMWTLVSGTGSVITPTSPTSNVTGLSVGANVFEWTISNGTCPSSSDQVTITVDPNPTVAIAGSDQTLCASSASLSGNAPTIGTGLWTLVSGTGTMVNPSAAVTAVNGMLPGQNIFQWTISNGVCASSSDQVTINVDGIPTTANAGSDQTFCSSFITLNGNTPLVGSGTWTVIAGGGALANPNLPTTNVTALPVGVNIFEWTISNGVCPVSADTVAMTVDAQPSTANAGIDQQLCSTLDTMNGNVPVIGTGTWTLVLGSGTLANPSSASTTITALGVGTNVFAWTISNGTCPSSSDQLTVTRDDFPTLPAAGADMNSCSTVDSLSGNVPIIGTGTWTVLTGSATVANPSSPFTSVSNMSIGTNEFLWTISNGVCPSRYDTMLITYNQPPSPASAGADIFACDEQITMQAQVPSVGTGIWVPIGGSPLIIDSTNPNGVVPLLPPGTWNYVWTTQNGFCISSPDTIAITVYSPPDSAVCGNDLVIYNPDITLSATPITTGTGTWTFAQGSGSIEDIQDPFTRVTNLSVGVNILRWTTSNGVCPVSSDEMRIEVMQLIVPEGFSPNGDGVNDQFEIIGLNEFGKVSLEVFNRWGNVVYTSGQYQNDWTGRGESGEVLPDDVYYYILKTDTETVFTGFVVIKRNVQ